MLVKKFEAPTIKEALALVKTQLGPDAIILSAKENNSGFGLAGRTSVEVTAAVSETQLKKKQFAEARLRESDRERLKQSPARVQRDFIAKSVSRFNSDGTPEPEPQKGPSRYIDIIDDESLQGARAKAASPRSANSAVYGRVQQAAKLPKHDISPAHEARRRVKDATQSALAAAKSFTETAPPRSSQMRPQAQVSQPRAPQQEEVLNLKAELEQLKGLLEGLKKSPAGVISLHPGAEAGLPFETSHLYQRLTESGIAEGAAVELCRSAMNELSLENLKRKGFVDAWAAKEIMNTIQLTADPYKSGLHLFVGPSGQGKTSSLVKVASHLVIKERRSVAIVTTDSRKVGAAEQLRIYAQILNVPFAVIRNQIEWMPVLSQLRHVDVVLVDNPGLPLKQLAEIDLFQASLPPSEIRKQVHLVLSVNQKDLDAFEIARRYKLAHFDDVIFTKLDESANHGLIWNFQREFKTPLHSFGIGPMIPEDYEAATRERVIDLIFKISKLKG